MGDTTGIAWTDHTFNPWMGCTKVSAGCANCYAETLVVGRMGHDVWGPGKPRKMTSVGNWLKPVKWNKEAAAAGRRDKVFCASLADVFDAEAPKDGLSMLWDLIRRTPNLDWQLLTKRPERIAFSLPPDWGDGYANVWLGTSVENQANADERIPILASIPAVVRFLSVEPQLGGVDLSGQWTDGEEWDFEVADHVHWVICGGESGPGHRPFNADWARWLRDWCAKEGVAFFFKQHGGLRPTDGGHLLDGREHYGLPK